MNLKYSASGLSLSKEWSGFSVAKDTCELNGSKESTEPSLLEIYMSVETEVEITYEIRLITLISISIDHECDSKWSSRGYLYSYYAKQDGSLGRFFL